MQKFAQVHLKAETLARYRLPDIAYPVPMNVLMAGLGLGALALPGLPVGRRVG